MKDFKEQLKESIELITSLNDYCDKLYHELHFDVFETPLFQNAGRLFDLLVESHYNEYGQDWINWWVFDNECGKNGLEAFENDAPICTNFDELYEYCQKYRK